MPRFQVHAVANHHDAVQCEPRFGAVPGNELIDGVFIDAARGWRAEAVEHRQSAMIQIRQPKHSATVVRLDSLFAHSDGLQCRSIWDDGGRLDVARRVALRSGLGGFERYGLVSSTMILCATYGPTVRTLRQFLGAVHALAA